MYVPTYTNLTHRKWATKKQPTAAEVGQQEIVISPYARAYSSQFFNSEQILVLHFKKKATINAVF